jgi:diacylglycerol kinase family enzyme
MRHLFVINPRSFVELKSLKSFLLSVEDCFSTGKRAEYKIYISRYPRDAIAAVNRYIGSFTEDETVRVYAVGGDGILFDCLNGIIGHENAELASVPYGNANDFLRAFGQYNVKRFRDIKTLSHSGTLLTDIIKCGTNYSILNTSIGLESSAAPSVEPLVKLVTSSPNSAKIMPFVYNLGGLKCILDKDVRLQYYDLYIDGEDYSGTYININVANTFGNGGNNAPNPYAVPDDGLFDVVLIKPMSAIKCIRLFSDYVKGKANEHPDQFIVRRGRHLLCKSDRILRIDLDGEYYLTNQIEMQIIPKAVKVVVPDNTRYLNFFDASVDQRINKKGVSNE